MMNAEIRTGGEGGLTFWNRWGRVKKVKFLTPTICCSIASNEFLAPFPSSLPTRRTTWTTFYRGTTTTSRLQSPNCCRHLFTLEFSSTPLLLPILPILPALALFLSLVYCGENGITLDNDVVFTMKGCCWLNTVNRLTVVRFLSYSILDPLEYRVIEYINDHVCKHVQSIAITNVTTTNLHRVSLLFSPFSRRKIVYLSMLQDFRVKCWNRHARNAHRRFFPPRCSYIYIYIHI